ncbi:MAG: MBL fold metallo-hydrolase, partial [Treponema sp.]|nr:MBL fold metallo-hydrolase [Treponema sp.]
MIKPVKILFSVLGGLGILIAAIFLIALVFVLFWPSFGGSASRQDKIDYAGRAPNFYDGVFHNDNGFSPMSLQKNPAPDPKKISDNTPRPDFEFPVKTPDFIQNGQRGSGQRAPIDEFNSTWMGHSTIFMQMHGMNILFDPVFSEVISPVSFVGSRRFSHPSITVEQLPEVDILILTHDH